MRMQVAPPSAQISYLCMQPHLVIKFPTNVNGATWLPIFTYVQISNQYKWSHLVANCLLIHVAPPGDQISYKCKWHHLVAKFPTNSCGANWWPKFFPMQVAPPVDLLTKFASYKVPPVMVSTHGSVVPLAMFQSKTKNRIILTKQSGRPLKLKVVIRCRKK